MSTDRSVDRPAGGTQPHEGAARQARITGLDLARFVAIAGMVVVHGAELAELPPSSSTYLAADGAPRVLEWVPAVATNRARLLFFLLAGVSLRLLAGRHRAGTGVLLRRAAFLTALGVLLALLGWQDVVLVFYGVVFVLAPLLLRLTTRVLLAVAVISATPGVLLFVLDPAREAALTGTALVVGEVVPVFSLGLAVGRLPLLASATARALAVLGIALAVPGLVGLAAVGGLDVTEVDGPFELVSALTSSTGLALLVLAGCLRLGRSTTAMGWLMPAAAAGGMPLSLYVGHALLFPVVARTAEPTLAGGTAVAVCYLAVSTAFAVLWRRGRSSGPVEAALRWTTRT
jgi:uncharacterized membrane protein YeiB